jgi:hypothetical protein
VLRYKRTKANEPERVGRSGPQIFPGTSPDMLAGYFFAGTTGMRAISCSPTVDPPSPLGGAK